MDQLALTSCLSSDATFTYCLSPHCTAGHLHDGGSSQPIFRCSACDCRSCVPCGVLWHEDLTCEQYQQSVKDAAKNDEIARQVQARLVTEEAASNEAVKALSKVCPNKACSARIEKNGGCDHMTVSVLFSTFLEFHSSHLATHYEDRRLIVYRRFTVQQVQCRVLLALLRRLWNHQKNRQ